MNLILNQRLRRFLKETFLLSLLISLPVFAWVRLIFFEVPFSLSEDLSTLVRVVFTGWLLIMGLKAGFIGLLALGYKLRHRRVIIRRWRLTAVAVVLLCSLLYACQAQPLAGINKDLTTGLSTTYKGLAPERSFLVMNDEELNHTDIPIGEKFLLINKGVKGFREKNGKIVIGCALSIKDKNGKSILHEADLFKGHDQYDPKDAEYLKCTVNTGEPMQWEEKYDVEVVFWDKNGTGRITNKVTIRMIDIP